MQNVKLWTQLWWHSSAPSSPSRCSRTGLWKRGLSILHVAAPAILLLWLVHSSIEGTLGIPRTGAMIPLSIFLALCLAQLIPLPTFLAKMSIVQTLFPVVSVQATRLGTVYAWQTVQSLLSFLAYAAVFFVLIDAIRSRDQLRRAMYVVSGTGLVVFLTGAAGHLFDPDGSHGFSMPFINPNHFAACLTMTALFSLGILVACVKIRASFSTRLFFGACSASSVMGVVWSFSRGAVVALGVGSVVLAVLLFVSRRTRQTWWLTIVGILVVIALTFAILPAETSRRLLSPITNRVDPSLLARWQVWRASIPIFTASPVTGWGLGSFKYIFPRFQASETKLHFDHAHNEYLQLLIEAGVIGFAAIAWGVMRVLGRIIRLTLKRRDPCVVGGVFGGISGLIAVLLHSSIDFPLRIGSNALLFTVILALVFVLSRTSFRDNTRRSFFSEWRIELTGLRRAVIPVCGFLGLMLIAWFSIAPYWAQSTAKSAADIADSDRDKAKNQMLLATRIDPSNAAIHAKCSDMFAQKPKSGMGKMSDADLDIAISHVCKAIGLCPTRAAYRQKLGWLYGRRSDWTPSPIADLGLIEMNTAISWQPNNAYRHRALARWALKFAEKSPEMWQAALDDDNDGELEAYVRLVLEEYTKASLLNPEIGAEFFKILEFHAESSHQAASLLPTDGRIHYQYAAYLKKQHRDKEADRVYADTVALLRSRIEENPGSAQDHFTLALCILLGVKNPALASEEFRRAIELDQDNATFRHWYARMLVLTHQYEEAVVQELRATTLEPDRAEAFYWLGRARHAMGEDKEALDAYRRAHALDPTEPAYRLNVEKLLSAIPK